MTSPPLTDLTPASTRADLFRALGVLAEPPEPEHPRLAGLLDLPAPSPGEWTEAFVVQLVPHASIYLGLEGMLGGEALDRIAGFWRALRQPVPGDPDHLSALLGLYASALEAEASEPDAARRALWGQARRALLHEHLISWLIVYADAMIEVGPAAYEKWARLLRDALLAESTEIGAPDVVPAHLRDASAAEPAASEPSPRLDLVIDELLTPVRAGVVVTRGHLEAAARHGGLGLRLGERRRILRALIEQDPAAILGWLVEHAHGWVDRHRAVEPKTGPIAAFWAGRAAATAARLRAAQHEISHLQAHPPTPKERDR